MINQDLDSNIRHNSSLNKWLKTITKITSVAIVAATLTVSTQANAGLITRTITVSGGTDVEAYYDDVLDITWLKDANYAQTSNYAGADADGLMDWDEANTWASNLTIGDYSDWRLPTVTASDSVNGFDYTFKTDGSSDVGYNITSITHEMAYMFNVNLGLASYCPTGTCPVNTNTEIDTATLGNNIEIDHLIRSVYWSGTEHDPNIFTAWFFITNNGGEQGNFGFMGSSHYAWAVHAGDVGAATNPSVDVPEPTSIALLALGMMGLVFRRFKKK